MFNVSFNDVNWNPNAPFPMSAKATGPPNMEFGDEPDLADFGEALADFAFLEDGSVAGHHRPRSLTESESDGEDSSSPRGPDLFSCGVVPPSTTAFSLAPAPSNAPARRVLTRTVTHSDEDGEDNGADVPSSSPVSAAVEGAETFDDFLSALSHGGRVSPDHNVKAASSSTTTTTTSQVFSSAPAEMSDCDEGQDDDALPSSSELESVVSGFSSSDFEEDDEDEDDLLGGAYGRNALPPTMSVMGLLGGGVDEESNHDLGFLGVAAGVAGDEAAASAFSAAAAKTASQLGSPEDAEEYVASSSSVASSKRGRGRGTGASGRKRARKVSPPHGSQKQQHQQAGARGPRSKTAHRSLAAAAEQGKHAVSGVTTSASSVAPLSALKGALSSSRRRCRAYVEGLKKQMTDLSAKQRALAQAEASSDFFDAAWAAVDAKALEAEEVSVRQGVVRAFLQLRGAGVGDKARWKDLVSEDFEFVLPRTPYRSMPSSCSASSKASRLAAAAAAAAASKEPLEEGLRRVVGVEAVAADASSMGALCETLRNRVRALKPDLPRKKIAGIKLVYDCGEDAASPSLARWEGNDDEEDEGGNSSDASSDCAAEGTPPTTAGAAGRAAGGEAPFPGGILVSGERAMCHWRGGTSGLVACGFDSECVVDGMLRCSANPATHKLQKLELTFDVLAFTQQLQRMGLVADPASSALLMGGAAAAFPLLGMASAMFGAAAASSAAAHSLASTVTTKGPPLAIRPSSGKVPILCAKPSSAGGGMPLPGAAGGLDPAVMREMMLKAMGAASKAAKQQQQQGSTEATCSSSATTSTATTGSSSSSSGGATAAAAAQQQQPMTAQQMQMQAMMMAAAMMAKTTAQTGATASGATTTSASTGGPVASTSTKTTIQPAALGKKRSAPAKAASSSVVAAAAGAGAPSTYGGNRALGSAKHGACAVPPTLPVAAIAAPRASGVVSSVSTPPLPSLVPS